MKRSVSALASDVRERVGRSPLRVAPAVPAVWTGQLVELDDSGCPWITIRGSSSPTLARSTLPITVGDLGRVVSVAFEEGDVGRPIVLGMLVEPGDSPVRVALDGDRLTLRAKREIELRCGEASLVLAADGSVRIQGSDIASNASGQQRIRGASVKIN